MKKHFFTCVCLWCIPFVLLAAIPERPNPPRLVNDLAGIFTAGERAQLEQTLVAFNDTTSNQIVVLTVSDLDGQEASAYAWQVGETWKVGQEKFDNGVVVLVKPKPANGYGDVFIAVGYGLEGALPDAVCKTIVEQEMIPQFRYNNYFEGVCAAVSVIMPIAAGEYSSDAYMNGNGAALPVIIILILIVVIAIIVVAMKNNTPTNMGSGKKSSDFFTWWMLGRMSSGGRHHGGSGGGFSGGSFGGFGGGSFGGGGAGGRW
jgi:uncharacterized protein